MGLKLIALILFLITAYFAIGIYGHLCLLKKRQNESNGNAMTWSLPYGERCICTKVVPLPDRYGAFCDRWTPKTESEPLWWFIDSPGPLILRENWTPTKLDVLLERVAHCGASNTEAPTVEGSPLSESTTAIEASQASTTEALAIGASSAEALSTVASTAAAATAAASTAAASTAAASTAAAATAAASTAAASTAAASTAAASTAAASTTEALTTDVITTEVITTEATSTIAPVVTGTECATLGLSTAYGCTGRCTLKTDCYFNNYVEGFCPNQEGVECCLTPYNDPECEDTWGICISETQCTPIVGETVIIPGKCPSKPSGVSCCVNLPPSNTCIVRDVVPSDCLFCMCQVLTGCTIPNPICNEETAACGPYQITAGYYIDATTHDWVADTLPAGHGGGLEQCSSNFHCSEQIINGYMKRYSAAADPPAEPTCENFARLHKGGLGDFRTDVTLPYWNQVKQCLDKLALRNLT